jgi:hypothetical protein
MRKGTSMSKKKLHKFEDKMELTYEQYFRDTYAGIVRFARELERILGRDKALEIIGKTAEKLAVESAKAQVAGTEPVKSLEDFRRLLEGQLESPFWTHALTATFPMEKRQEFTGHVTECIWAKTFKDMDATDIGYLWICQPDFATAQIYNPKIKLRRTKTLMQGDNCCNHTYYWEEGKTTPRKVTKR